MFKAKIIIKSKYIKKSLFISVVEGCRGRDRMVVVSLDPAHGEVYAIQHYAINFVNDFRQVGGFSEYSGFFRQ